MQSKRANLLVTALTALGAMATVPARLVNTRPMLPDADKVAAAQAKRLRRMERNKKLLVKEVKL